jgi:hypothetical protein
VAWDFASVLNLDCLLDGLIDKDVPKIDLLLSKVSLWSKSFSFKLKWESFLCTRNVAIRHTVVSACSDWHKSHSDGDFRVGPDFTDERLDSEDFILEEEEVVFDGFSDSLVLSGKRKLGSFSFPFKVFSVVEFFFRR